MEAALAPPGGAYKESLEVAALGLPPKGEYDVFGKAGSTTFETTGMGVSGTTGGGTTTGSPVLADPGAEYKESLLAPMGLIPNGEYDFFGTAGVADTTVSSNAVVSGATGIGGATRGVSLD